jgi:uncharacterized membrane protein HdeD (DUF308 family)
MARTFMKVLGAVLVLVGIVGFFIPFTGLLDLTFTHNLIHLVTGIAALAVSGSAKNSVLFSKVFGVVYLLVGVLGLFVTDVMGLIHLMPADNVIHFVVAIAALYIGFKSESSSSSVSRSA